jgi:tetratricopeptide (TPR) repeat protein
VRKLAGLRASTAVANLRILAQLIPLGVTSTKNGIAMRRLLFSLLIFSTLAPCPILQTGSSTQQALKPKSESIKWTKLDEGLLLAKAQPGDAGSQMWLASAYEQGWFGKTNFQEALKWFRRSAEQGDPDAQDSLGQMYEDGEGVTQNYSLAAKWYRKAAEHVPDFGGAGQGRNNLGILYLDGRGVPRDYVQAYMWFRLANFESNGNLSFAKTHMTSKQILEGERLVEEWKSQHIKQ